MALIIWYGFDFVAGLLMKWLSKSPTPGFLADFPILLPLFRISGPALVWTLVVDCGGLTWPGSKYHRCWTWIPPGGRSYILLPVRLFGEISVGQPQLITSYWQTSPRQDVIVKTSEILGRHHTIINVVISLFFRIRLASPPERQLQSLHGVLWWRAKRSVGILWKFFNSSWVWSLPWGMKWQQLIRCGRSLLLISLRTGGSTHS